LRLKANHQVHVQRQPAVAMGIHGYPAHDDEPHRGTVESADYCLEACCPHRCPELPDTLTLTLVASSKRLGTICWRPPVAFTPAMGMLSS